MRSKFRRLYPYLWKYRAELAAGLLCLILTNYLDIQVAVLLGDGIDVIRFNLGAFSPFQDSMLTLFIALTAGLAACSALARFWMRQLIIGASRHVEYDFRNDFFKHLLRLSASFYDRFRTGDIMSRATSDMEAIRMVIGPAIMYMASTLTIIPMTIVKMAHLSPLLTLLCWLPLGLIGPHFFFFSRRIHRRFRRTQEQMSDLSANVQENLSGVRVLKVYSREEQQAGHFDHLSQQYVEENMRLALLQSIFIPVLTLIVGLAMLMLLLGGSMLIIRNELTIGALVTFSVLLANSIWPMAAFGWVLAQIERGSASMQRVEEIFLQEPEVTDEAGPAAGDGRRADGNGRHALGGQVVCGRIELRDLTFTYPGAAQPSLRGITLEVPAGTTLGLTGPVGCGKSTLAALLARRYNPPRGTVLIDGMDILDWPAELLRRQIGIVDQEPFLFSDTIEANIAYGLDSAPPMASAPPEASAPPDTIKRITREAARIAQLDRDIEAFPHGYETLLGERGINLSGGQRQRAALARALARDPALLVLDDALAAVDTQTEEAILRGLRQVLGDRTTVLISHRISTVSLADTIVYLEEGKIAEMGTHEQLMLLRGPYWSLAMRQRLAEEIEKTA